MLEIKVILEASESLQNALRAFTKAVGATAHPTAKSVSLPVVAGETAPKETTPAPMPKAEADKTYTVRQITNAAATLVNAGRTDELRAALVGLGVTSVIHLKPEQYAEFAAKLIGLGVEVV